ncbi:MULTISPECIES: TonB-dependent receptor [Olivibacter]|jgi:iron complex outermembrane receptor protein|uniref:TonB-dependent receptor n=1 Tax=Olivibacter oleidegradans TaxID=760123 RepID=A0ABV6HS43_9SPHI|nr:MULTISPECIES: TonB-dependent receptor [unclassified Olivibacter]MDM8176329.1 TonB-dependent receptor [Olivibacter sp. 47]QEL01085.1 TonB-dependent receptor [Olivibacter sp. LS-1]
MFIKKQFTWLLLLLCSHIGYAQNNDCNFMINGRLIDSDTQLPLAGATVRIMPANRTVKTDGHGFYRLSSLCEGTYTLSFESLGFEKTSRTLNITKNETLHIALKHGDIVLHDVEVVGHQNNLKTTSVVNSLTQQQLRESKGGVLAEVLKEIPGVTMLQTGATIAKPVIHGMHSNRILMLNNGIRQEGQQWGNEHAPEIDPFVAKNIRVIKGAESVRYGAEAIGGVIIVEPPTLPINPEIHGEIDVVGQSNGRGGITSAMLNGGLKKIPGFSWRAQGSFKRLGDIKSADYYLNNTGVKEINYSASLGYKTSSTQFEAYYSHFETELGIFNGSHIGSVEDLQSRIENGKPFITYPFSHTIEAPRQEIKHDLLKLKAHRDFTNGAQMDIQYGLQRNLRKEYDIRRGGRTGIPSLDLELTSQNLDITYDHLKENGLRSIIGVNLAMQVNNNIPGTFATPLIPNYDSYNAGLFIIERWVKPTYEIEAGIRYDYKYFDAAGYRLDSIYYAGTRTFHNFSGSLGATWHVHKSLDVQSNIGLAWRPPSVSELFSYGLHHGTAAVEIGNDQFKSEQGLKWMNAVKFQLPDFDLELDAYAHYIKNYIYLQSTGEFWESLRGAFPVFHYKQTNALFWGLDLTGSYQLTENFRYTIKGSLVRAKDTRRKNYLPWIPSDRVENALRWTKSRQKRHLNNTFIQVQHQFVTRQSRYEPNTDFAPPPPAYGLLNVMGGLGFRFNQQDLNFQLGINNLLNKEYKEYMNRFRYYAHDMGRNVTLKLNYIF